MCRHLRHLSSHHNDKATGLAEPDTVSVTVKLTWNCLRSLVQSNRLAVPVPRLHSQGSRLHIQFLSARLLQPGHGHVWPRLRRLLLHCVLHCSSHWTSRCYNGICPSTTCQSHGCGRQAQGPDPIQRASMAYCLLLRVLASWDGKFYIAPTL